MKTVAETKDLGDALDQCVQGSDNTDNADFMNTYEKMKDVASEIDNIWENDCDSTMCFREDLEKIYTKSKEVKSYLEEMQQSLSSCDANTKIIHKISKAEELCEALFA